MFELKNYREVAANSDLIALGTILEWDHETSVALADRFVERNRMFLLESATSGPRNVARYSFVGFDPLWVWSMRGRTIASSFPGENHDGTTGSKTLPKGHNAIDLLHQDLRRLRLGTLFAVPAQIGAHDLSAMNGLVGFIGFDIASVLEPSAGEPPPDALELPDMDFQFPRNFLILDHLARKLHVYRYAYVGGIAGEGLSALFVEEQQAFLQVISELRLPKALPALHTRASKVDLDRGTKSFTKDKFAVAGEKCLEFIRAGELFQIQISNRVAIPTTARPFNIFRHLRMINPSPYMFYYKFGDDQLYGASPEMMVISEGKRVVQRPIAGTRRRTWDRDKDAAMRAELTASEKERAEHVMLVDLCRNDIGRMAAPGSVKVEELMTVEEYSHVFHMVSQVTGELRDDIKAADVVSLSFPNGTVCGAPKIRAIQGIYELEPVSRSFYGGTLALFDLGGNVKSTLLIRTIHQRKGIATTQAAAGFVFDSTVDEEWLETRNKMAACITAIQNTI
jgi:anthranilate synthase component 1